MQRTKICRTRPQHGDADADADGHAWTAARALHRHETLGVLGALYYDQVHHTIIKLVIL